MTFVPVVMVVAAALFLIGLAGTIVVRPPLAERFLSGFASTAKVHLLEQAVRLVVGGALVLHSGAMWQGEWFWLFGWILIVTTLGLLCVPWRWHRRFAGWVVPPVIRVMPLFAVGAAVLGVLLLLGVFGGVGG